jgi:Cornifin (SPRR) family
MHLGLSLGLLIALKLRNIGQQFMQLIVWCGSCQVQTNTGSIMQLCWSSEGTMLAGGGGTGAVCFAKVVDLSMEDGRVVINMVDEHKITVHDILTETKDELDFRYHTPCLKQVMRPCLKQVMRPCLKQVMRPCLKQVMLPCLKQVMRTCLKQVMHTCLKQVTHAACMSSPPGDVACTLLCCLSRGSKTAASSGSSLRDFASSRALY